MTERNPKTFDRLDPAFPEKQVLEKGAGAFLIRLSRRAVSTSAWNSSSLSLSVPFLTDSWPILSMRSMSAKLLTAPYWIHGAAVVCAVG